MIAKVTETDGQCVYRCLLVVRKLTQRETTQPDISLAFNTQEYLLRGEMPLGGKKQVKFDDGHTLILSIEQQDPNAFKINPEPAEEFRPIPLPSAE